MSRFGALILSSAIILGGCVPENDPKPPNDELNVPNSPAVESVKYEKAPVFETAWPTSFNRDELISSALSEIFASFDARKPTFDERKIAVYIDPEIPEQHHEWIRELSENTILMMSREIEETVSVIVGTQPSFMHQVVEGNSLDMPMVDDFGDNVRPCDYSWGACSGGNTIYVGAGTRGLDALHRSPKFARMLSHKSLHVVQDHIDYQSGGQTPPRDMENFRPVWFVEGFAEFYGYAMNDYLELHQYHQSQNRWFEYASLRDLEEWNLEKSEDKYLWGQAAIEYIVANVGFEALVELYLLLEEGQTFEEAFVNSVGIDLDQFYEAFDEWAMSQF